MRPGIKQIIYNGQIIFVPVIKHSDQVEALPYSYDKKHKAYYKAIQEIKERKTNEK